MTSGNHGPDWLTHPRKIDPLPEESEILPEDFPADEEDDPRDPFLVIQRIFLTIALILSIGIAAYCGYRIIDAVSAYHMADSEYAHLSESYVSAIQEKPVTDESLHGNTSAKSETSSKQETAFQGFTVDSAGLFSQNEDYRAWLYMEDPSISYPVMQSPSDDGEPFYLYRTFEKKHNPSGCLYIAHAASDDFSAYNTIIYGHNMRNQSMFGKLKTLYGKKASIGNHFYLDVMGTRKDYKIFAIVLTDTSSRLYRVPSEDTYSAYLQDVLSSAAQKDASTEGLEEHQPIVTLSTCYGRAGTTKRLLVFGVLQTSTQ